MVMIRQSVKYQDILFVVPIKFPNNYLEHHRYKNSNVPAVLSKENRDYLKTYLALKLPKDETQCTY